jgi:hypothetical protein
VTTDTPETMMTPLPSDRRPAIWPWLVMPLITLALFYGLDRLRHQRALDDLDPPQASSNAPASPENP